MYAIRWFDGGGPYEAVCANPEDAWMIYWVLKKYHHKRKIVTYEDYWIEIWNNGFPCNPEKGGQLPICQEGKGPVFILKRGKVKSNLTTLSKGAKR